MKITLFRKFYTSNYGRIPCAFLRFFLQAQHWTVDQGCVNSTKNLLFAISIFFSPILDICQIPPFKCQAAGFDRHGPTRCTRKGWYDFELCAFECSLSCMHIRNLFFFTRNNICFNIILLSYFTATLFPTPRPILSTKSFHLHNQLN